MYLNIHKSPTGEVVALCDSGLIGSKLSEGKIVLDLKRHADFYKGRLVGEREAVAALSGTANANIVGKKSLSAARKAGLDVSGAILISGVPHLQAYKV